MSAVFLDKVNFHDQHLTVPLQLLLLPNGI